MFSSLKLRHVFFLFLAIVTIRVLYYWQSDGFSLGRIHNTFPEKYELPAPSEKTLETLKEICDKPFSYLGKGSQAYAFQSADGKYVLKLFKCYHLKPIPWMENLQLPGFLDRYKWQQLKRRQVRATLALESYKITNDVIPEESGLIYLQIIPSKAYHQMVTFTDKLGRTMTIDLANHGFMIQKKADLIFPTLTRYVKENRLDDAKALIRSIFQIIVARSQKGIQDQDPDLHKNCGCIGIEAQFIDVGSFHRNEKAKLSAVYKNDLKKISNRLREFLVTLSPELVQIHDEELAAIN